MKTSINSIEELNEFLLAVSPEITNHEYESDGDLSSYSMENLRNEGRFLLGYLDSEDNYVPEYHGCGLISRCMKIAQNNQAIFTRNFFEQWDYLEEEIDDLCKAKWY